MAFQTGKSRHPGGMGGGGGSTVASSWQVSAKGLIGLKARVSWNETMQHFMYRP